MAGRGIMMLRPEDPNLRSILETATVRGLDGAPIGVVRRVASGTEFRCNMAAGAVTSPTGVREIDAFAGTRLSDYVIAWVEQRRALR
jgi:glutathione synthase